MVAETMVARQRRQMKRRNYMDMDAVLGGGNRSNAFGVDGGKPNNSVDGGTHTSSQCDPKDSVDQFRVPRRFHS
jgi:hypothetical protein